MATSPPPITGNSDDVRFKRWVVENTLRGQGDISSIRNLAQRAASRTDEVAIDSADIAVGVDVTGEQGAVGTSTDRVPAPLSNQQFWDRVVLGLDPNLSAMNVEATPMGLLMSPNTPDGAVVTLTSINPIPATRKFYVYAEADDGFHIFVDWLNPDFTVIDEEFGTLEVGSSRIEAPADATHYRFYAVRMPEELPSLLLKVNVFEIIGSGDTNSVELGPDSFLVKDENGNTVVDFTPDLPLIAALSTPTLETAISAVVAKWDGNLAAGGKPGASFSHAVIEWTLAGANAWTRIATPLTGAGSALIRGGQVGQTVEVRFIPIDRLGREGTASTVGSIIVEGVTLTDVDTAVSNAINQAVQDAATAKMTVDGKNRIFVQSEAPDPVTQAPISGGDQWWVLAEDGSLVGIQMWNPLAQGGEGAWVDYRIVASEIIVPGSVGGTLIADGEIDTNKLAANSIDATKIQALAILAEHIAAGSIQASHLDAGVGGAIDISANESVTFLLGKADDNANSIAAISTVYRLTPNGAEISKPQSPFALRIQNTGISITENGATVSYWNAGQMFVPSLVGEEVVAAHHKIEKYFAANGSIAGTVIRSTY